jgi:hypothetical protein
VFVPSETVSQLEREFESGRIAFEHSRDSGARLQPTAQAVGNRWEPIQPPKGRKNTMSILFAALLVSRQEEH